MGLGPSERHRSGTGRRGRTTMRSLKLLLTTGALGLATPSLAIGAVVSSYGPATPAPTEQQQSATNAYAKLPVSFVENRCQTDKSVRYYAQGNGYGFYMTPSQVTLSFTKQDSPDGVALALRFLGGNPQVEPRGGERAAGV